MAGGLWTRIKNGFAADAEHVTTCFLPAPGSAPIWPAQGYLRLWLAEGFLARARTWGNDRFPVLHAGASLTFGAGAPVAFTTFSRPAAAWAVPGDQFDFPITPLLPFNGGTVEIEAAVYQAAQTGPLGTAASLVAGFAELLGPPLATAASVANAISTGLDSLIDASGDEPVLGVHYAMISPGGGGQPVQAGHLVVVNAPPGSLPGELTIGADGRLAVRGDPDAAGGGAHSAGDRRLTGFDYLVVRVETRTEHDIWLSPTMTALISQARLARAHGRAAAFADYRAEAVTLAWTSADYVESDRPRIAAAIAAALAAGPEQAAFADGDPDATVADEVIALLPARDDPALAGLTLADLLAP
ncbi:hypothetical protein ND748_13280 [Frankia sp. AiPs1]|uniref:hypothetical protein n=1 Tax=Frankia sp. AiPs1 TaxID=573493 RepID=UPI002042D951|nr:hypothetical protein [Frankia sp. AiPs1]MCM3922627.1 hypothetical protein [Frankia sp. AiPs1]